MGFTKYLSRFAPNIAKTELPVGKGYCYFSITSLACARGRSGGVLFFVDMIEI
jgi:hypothetical protein